MGEILFQLDLKGWIGFGRRSFGTGISIREHKELEIRRSSMTVYLFTEW